MSRWHNVDCLIHCIQDNMQNMDQAVRTQLKVQTARPLEFAGGDLVGSLEESASVLHIVDMECGALSTVPPSSTQSPSHHFFLDAKRACFQSTLCPSQHAPE
jgi:hypothetical protein